ARRREVDREIIAVAHAYADRAIAGGAAGLLIQALLGAALARHGAADAVAFPLPVIRAPVEERASGGRELPFQPVDARKQRVAGRTLIAEQEEAASAAGAACLGL